MQSVETITCHVLHMCVISDYSSFHVLLTISVYHVSSRIEMAYTTYIGINNGISCCKSQLDIHNSIQNVTTKV